MVYVAVVYSGGAMLRDHLAVCRQPIAVPITKYSFDKHQRAYVFCECQHLQGSRRTAMVASAPFTRDTTWWMANKHGLPPLLSAFTIRQPTWPFYEVPTHLK